jgi:hypothetical protein
MSENLPVNERPRYGSHSSALWVGMALVIVGGMLLLDNMGIHLFWFNVNWWALFMLIPAAMILNKGYQGYLANGQQFEGEARRQLIIGGVIAAMAIFFLFGLNTVMLWPALLILAGALLLINTTTNR